MQGKTKKIQGYTIYLEKKLGEGSFGKVYVAQKNDTKQKCAVKMLERKMIDKDEYIKNAVFSQIQILKLLKSPNIVGFYDVMESDNYYYIIQEFCDGGDLKGLIEKRKIFSQAQAIEMLKQICSGFIGLIKEGVIHRDMKPENVLINQGVLKLADFGFSKKINNKRIKNQTMVGTPLYMSLEILKGEPYSSKCDIWAVGLMFYEFLAGRTPWSANTQYQLINGIQKNPIKMPQNISDKAKSFIIGCLQIHESQRFSWQELLRQPIFNGYFTNFIKEEQILQNKFKTVINKLRFKIQAENIDLERLFKDRGYNKNSKLNFSEFQEFIMTVDTNISNEEKRFMFEKIDIDDSDSIQYGQLEQCLKQNNIPMQSQRYQLVKKQSSDNENILESKKQLNNKIYKAFEKLILIMRERKFTLAQFFDNYNIEKNGLLKINQFQRFIVKLEKSFTKDEIKVLFTLIDSDNGGEISFEEFHIYFCKVTGQPFYNFMNKSKNIFKNNSNPNKNSNINMNLYNQSPTYPNSISPSHQNLIHQNSNNPPQQNPFFFNQNFANQQPTNYNIYGNNPYQNNFHSLQQQFPPQNIMFNEYTPPTQYNNFNMNPQQYNNFNMNPQQNPNLNPQTNNNMFTGSNKNANNMIWFQGGYNPGNKNGR